MSSVGASANVGAASVRAAASAPPIVWIAMSVVVALAVLAWNQYGQDPEDTDWLDPAQPPIAVPVDFVSTVPGGMTAPGAPPTGRRRPRPYPFDSLMQHPCCWVGDC